MTASLGFLRQRGGRVQVRLGGCGHPGPAVVRADGRVEILEVDGMPLGLFGELGGEPDWRWNSARATCCSSTPTG